MRNVITLSDIPKDLHDWLKKEAARRTRLTGKRVGIYQVVVQAVQEYKGRLENHSRKRGIFIPTMELFRKKIQPSEMKRGCVCVPKGKWFYFGRVGNNIAMQDSADGSTCSVMVGSQYRLGMRSWYSRHRKIKPGDEIIFEQTNGTISIKVVTV